MKGNIDLTINRDFERRFENYYVDDPLINKVQSKNSFKMLQISYRTLVDNTNINFPKFNIFTNEIIEFKYNKCTSCGEEVRNILKNDYCDKCMTFTIYNCHRCGKPLTNPIIYSGKGYLCNKCEIESGNSIRQDEFIRGMLINRSKR